MSNDYTVKLQIFEGPLDLLLHLIKANEMDITEIAISQITGQYLEYLRLMETMDLEVAGDYLVIAATLIHIKLRSLLPAAPEEVDEEEEDVDHFLSARALLQQLIEYRKFKEAALDLGRRGERQSLIFNREVPLPSLEAEPEPAVRLDIDKLLGAFTRVLKFVEKRNDHRVVNEEYTVEEKVTMLRRRLLGEARIGVFDIFQTCRAKIEMIVTLIAMLELCRLKELRVAQGDAFGEIYIEHRPGDERDSARDARGEANELERVEAEIVANRTGLVDDGVLPEDDEPLESDEAERTQNSATQAGGTAIDGETGNKAPMARVIEIDRDEQTTP